MAYVGTETGGGRSAARESTNGTVAACTSTFGLTQSGLTYRTDMEREMVMTLDSKALYSVHSLSAMDANAIKRAHEVAQGDDPVETL